VLSVVRFEVLRKAAQIWQQSSPGRNRHIRDHAFRNMVALAARQLPQQPKREERSGNYQERNKTDVSQAGGRKIKILPQPPHGPAGKLRGDNSPYGNVKPALFRAFIAGGTGRARSEAQDRGKNNDRCQRIIKLVEEIVDDPAAKEKVDDQADQVDGERHQQVNPRSGVADHAIPEIRFGLTVMRDVGSRLAAGEASCESAPDTGGGYNRQPDPVAAVRAVRIKISRKMARENPEYPYPDGDVEHAVVVLVLFTFNDFFHE